MHLALKSAMSRIPYTNKVGETLGSIADSAAAYSLRALNGGDPTVARVRRSSDDAEKDFTASDMDSGSVADWVNGKQDTTLPCDVASAAAAYSLRSVNSNYTGSVVRVRRSSDDAEKDFIASDVSGSALVDWVNSVVDLVSSDLSDNTWTETGSGTATFSASGVSGGSGPKQVLSNKVFQQGTKVRVQINLTANVSNNTQLGVHFYNVNNGSLTAITPNGASSRNIDSEFTLTADSKIRIRAEGGTTADWSFSNFSVTSIVENGHVTTWYDQSGNGNDAVQQVSGSQPKIVDGGVLVSDGIKFDGVDDFFDFTNGLNFYNNPCSLFATCGASNFPLLGNNNNRRVVFNSSEIYFYLTGLAQDFNHNQALLSGLNQFSVIHNGTSTSPNSSAYLNSVENDPTASSGGSALANDSTNFIGKNTGVPLFTYDSSISEIIIYDSDQSSNRFKIESNINNHYGLYTNANDGFVTSWYDQSGNDNHATQSTAGSQPKIVDGGVHLGELDFDGVDDFFDTSCSLSAPFQVFFAGLIDNASKRQNFFDTSSGSRVLASWRPDASPDALRLQSVNAPTGQLTYSNDGTFTNDVSFVLNFLLNGLNSEISKNGTLLVTGDAGSASINSLRIAKDTQSTGEYCYSGTIFEIIIYNSDQSANRAAIEANINNHYDIY